VSCKSCMGMRVASPQEALIVHSLFGLLLGCSWAAPSSHVYNHHVAHLSRSLRLRTAKALSSFCSITFFGTPVLVNPRQSLTLLVSRLGRSCLGPRRVAGALLCSAQSPSLRKITTKPPLASSSVPPAHNLHICFEQ
jgi:hypothetical protein